MTQLKVRQRRDVFEKSIEFARLLPARDELAFVALFISAHPLTSPEHTEPRDSPIQPRERIIRENELISNVELGFIHTFVDVMAKKMYGKVARGYRRDSQAHPCLSPKPPAFDEHLCRREITNLHSRPRR